MTSRFGSIPHPSYGDANITIEKVSIAKDFFTDRLVTCDNTQSFIEDIKSDLSKPKRRIIYKTNALDADAVLGIPTYLILSREKSWNTFEQNLCTKYDLLRPPKAIREQNGTTIYITLQWDG